MLFVMVLVIYRIWYIVLLMLIFDILLLLDGMVWRNGDYIWWLYLLNWNIEILDLRSIYNNFLVIESSVFKKFYKDIY